MSVQRCPNCGRAWDGLLCFACGHEPGKPIAAKPASTAAPSPAPQPLPQPLPLSPAPVTSVSSMPAPFLSPSSVLPPPPSFPPSPSFQPPPAPSAGPVSMPSPSSANPFSGGAPVRPSSSVPPPTFARTHTPGPQFAPLPPLPALGRAPTASTAIPGVGTPPPPAAAPAPFGPPSGNFPSPFGGELTLDRGPLPPVTPRAANLNAPRAEQRMPSPVAPPPPRPPPSSPAAAQASGLDNETTFDGADAAPRWYVLWRKLYTSPAIFGAAFVIGFFVTFGPGAALWLSAPSASDLLAQRRYADVIAMMKDREDAGKLRPGDWVVYGHALERQYGRLRFDAMLDKYAVASKEKKVDATALENTIAALGDPDRQQKAIEILASWPASSDAPLDPIARLGAHAVDDNFYIRHGAAEALMKRNASADIVDDAWAAVAQKDLAAHSCEHQMSQEGVKMAGKLVDKGAKKALQRHNLYDLLIEYQDVPVATAACVDRTLVARTTTAYAGMMERR